jgi:cephalosporin hydroxylase
MNQIEVTPTGEFTLDGENFVIEIGAAPRDRRPSTSEGFTILKSEPYLRVYEDLASGFSPRSILELGIFQGGSFVFLDKLFKPRRMSALDIRAQPVAPLSRYVADKESRFLHFSTSQSNREVLENVVRNELANELDLVVDDASHMYEETKASFEILFPLLQPGGIYLIEDWSWAHRPEYQASDARFSNGPALSNLLFEQIMLMASTLFIAEIRVWHFLYLIQKAKHARSESKGENGSIFDQIRNRRKTWAPI